MHVAIDSRYLKRQASGIGLYVEELATRLPKLAPDISFTLWTHRLSPTLPPEPNVRRLTVGAEPNAVWSILWPHRYMDFSGVDLCHMAHNTLPRGVPRPSVVTLHDIGPIERPDLEFTHWREWPRRFYYASAQRRAIREAKRLITTTKAMADAVIAVEPSAIDRLDVTPLAPRRLDSGTFIGDRVAAITGSGSPYFLVVGQFSRSKRQATAVKAFATAGLPQHKLVLVQRQTTNHPLLSLSRKLGVAERVIWLPYVSTSELAALYRGATALIQPSIYEGFGLPILEAMSCSCPVIVSNLATLREVVDGAGILIEPENITSFAAAMKQLAGEPARRAELSAKAARRAADFSWDRTAALTLDIYRSAASSS